MSELRGEADLTEICDVPSPSGQDARSEGCLSDDAIGAKAAARSRNPPMVRCAAALFPVAAADLRCAESTRRLMIRIRLVALMAQTGLEQLQQQA